MDLLNTIVDLFKPFWAMVLVLVLGVSALVGLRRVLDKTYTGQADKNMRVQLITLVLSFILLIIVIIVSPISDSNRGQLLSLIGIVTSAAIALSSTTFLGNVMAGLMLRSIKGIRIGDFVSIGEHFGRVTERGLFHMELQTEESDLTSLPNLYLVTHPVKVVRASGTIIWCEISLGYDIPRTQVRDALIAAAESRELKDPFVHVRELGDFSVVYRVAGLLDEVKHLISERSRLREAALDSLHAAGIEIVSPTFMNTRALQPERQFIPEPLREVAAEPDSPTIEEIAFEKADQAESIEQMRQRLESMGEKIKKMKETAKATDDSDARAEIESQIDMLENTRERLVARIEDRVSESDDKSS